MIVLLLATAAACLPPMAGGVYAQGKRTTDVTVEGHVYEPAKLEPTAERIAALKVPAGFRVSKFAELSNPRMMAVAADGTVYVSQREPGTLTMLRDTNNNGVADVQRVVAEKKMLHGMAIHGGRMYIVTVNEVYVADMRADGTLGPLREIIRDLPDGGQHPNRGVSEILCKSAFGPAQRRAVAEELKL